MPVLSEENDIGQSHITHMSMSIDNEEASIQGVENEVVSKTYQNQIAINSSIIAATNTLHFENDVDPPLVRRSSRARVQLV